MLSVHHSFLLSTRTSISLIPLLIPYNYDEFLWLSLCIYEPFFILNLFISQFSNNPSPLSSFPFLLVSVFTDKSEFFLSKSATSPLSFMWMFYVLWMILLPFSLLICIVVEIFILTKTFFLHSLGIIPGKVWIVTRIIIPFFFHPAHKSNCPDDLTCIQIRKPDVKSSGIVTIWIFFRIPLYFYHIALIV